jgi:hypothetical protein
MIKLKLACAGLFALLLTTPTILADKGMWIPPEVNVYGPGQKAIVAWNGEQEVLILSTDVYALPTFLENLDQYQLIASDKHPLYENTWTLALFAPSEYPPIVRTWALNPFDENLLHEDIWVLMPMPVYWEPEQLRMLKSLDEYPLPDNTQISDGVRFRSLDEILQQIGRENLLIMLPHSPDVVWRLTPFNKHLLHGSTWVLEFLPLPSMPEVKEGDRESFTQIQRLLIEHARETSGPPTAGKDGAEGVEVVFHERIGAHDVRVVRVVNASEFVTWAENLLDNENIEYGAPPERLGTIVDTYLERGMSYFVFDLIEVGLSPNSIDPLIYRFQSDFLYYPLEVSSLASGTTNITLFTLTYGDIDEQRASESGLEVRFRFWLNKSELQSISPEIAGLFYYRNAGSACLTVLTYEGSLLDLSGDLMVSAAQDGVNRSLAAGLTTAMIASLVVIFALVYRIG